MAEDFFAKLDASKAPAPQPYTGTRVDAENPYAATALQRECEAVAGMLEGGRNHRLNKAAYSLAGLIGAGLTEAQVRDELTTAALASGLSMGEAHQTIESGIRGGLNAPRVVPDRETVALPTLDVPAAALSVPQADDQGLAGRFPPVDWHALWEEEDDDDWVVPGFWPARRGVALYSPPKMGKSLFALELAVCVSRGVPFMGAPVEQRRVLYVDFENDMRGDIRTRLESMGVGPHHLGDLIYLTYPSMAPLDTPEGGAELVAVAQLHRCEVVIIDTVSRTINGEENSNDTWIQFYRNTGLKLKQAGIGMLRLDHAGKNVELGQRGASAKSGDIDLLWRMDAKGDTLFELTCEAHRVPLSETVIVLHREVAPLHHRVDGRGSLAVWESQIADVIKALDALPHPSQTSPRDARPIVRAAGVLASQAVIKEACRRRGFVLSVTLEADSLTESETVLTISSTSPSENVNRGGEAAKRVASPENSSSTSSSTSTAELSPRKDDVPDVRGMFDRDENGDLRWK